MARRGRHRHDPPGRGWPGHDARVHLQCAPWSAATPARAIKGQTSSTTPPRTRGRTRHSPICPPLIPMFPPVTRLDQRPANQSNGHVFAFYIRSFGAGNGSAGGNSPIASETVTVQPPSTPSGLGHQHRDQVLRRGRPRPDTRDDGRPPARIHLALPPLRPVCLLARHGGSYRLNIQSNRVRSAPWPSSFQHNGGVFLPPWGKIEQWLISVQHDEADIARFTDNFAIFAAAIRT